jgi:polyphosphate kinase
VIARGICSLRPGVPGLSENIQVRSILGRFLEHSRVFNFEAGERHLYLMGSADLMPRNLDHRIEVVVPVEDSKLQLELNAVFDTLLADNTQAWVLDAGGSWERARNSGNGRSRATHATLMRRAATRSRRRNGLRRSR